MMKIGDDMYNVNYTPIYQPGQFQNYFTITRFRGLISEQNAFIVRRNGELLMGDERGRVYIYDQNNVFTDNGENIFTSFTSPWHTLQEAQSDLNLMIKDGRYIKPVFETYGEIEYNISVVAGYNREATDEITVTANGAALVGNAIIGNAIISSTPITNPKVPLRWRGEQFQINITSDSSVGADIISSYTIYGNIFGWR